MVFCGLLGRRYVLLLTDGNRARPHTGSDYSLIDLAIGVFLKVRRTPEGLFVRTDESRYVKCLRRGNSTPKPVSQQTTSISLERVIPLSVISAEIGFPVGWTIEELPVTLPTAIVPEPQDDS